MMMKRPYCNLVVNGMRMLFMIPFVCAVLVMQAQTVIDIRGSVYGGARQADVGGHTFVNIGADHHDVIIGSVYGGNDISGNIGTSTAEPSPVPSELDEAETNKITANYNAFVRISPEPTTTTGEGASAVTTQTHHIFIGNVFGGGNGDYTYNNNNGIHEIRDNKTNEVIVSTHEDVSDFTEPVLGKAYLELKGGTVAYVYGGGNNATVTSETDICIDNESKVTVAIPSTLTEADDIQNPSKNLLADPNRLEAMGISSLGTNALRAHYHYSRVFGGNNKAEMKIMPTWHLNKGRIDDLYSGGNAGKMTCPVGLLLEIDPQGSDEDKQKLEINNVYGGCRMANVEPKNGNVAVAVTNDAFNTYLREVKGFDGADYKFQDSFSARLLVRGGNVNNVYGGNDITGDIKGGNAVGVYTSIRGSIYGGGNGSYPYSDNPNLKEEYKLKYGDFYYEVPAGKTSAEALNDFRPNAEQVSIRVVGKATGENGSDSYHITPTVIGGAIYAGGNSASLKSDNADAIVHIKIGSHVIADSVFLGNNGANMVLYNEMDEEHDTEGVLRTFRRTDLTTDGSSYNSMDLTIPTQFAKYMEGCATKTLPDVVFDGDYANDPDTYEPYSSYFGSFFCGGNVGSIITPGKQTVNFRHEIIIYNKVVGGCNTADVAASNFNAVYHGGIIGSTAEMPDAEFGDLKYVADGKIKDRLELNLAGLKIQPRRRPVQGVDYEGDTYNLSNSVFDLKDIPLVWNTIKKDVRNEDGSPVLVRWNDNAWMPAEGSHSSQELSTVNRRLDGGNIYGGCYTSGVVNGNVVINIENSIVDRDIVFDEVETGDDGEVLYGHTGYTINRQRSGVILDEQGMDVLGTALNVFGGGKGKDTEIWGRTTVNLKKGYVFQIFGGSEEGVVGYPKEASTAADGTYDATARTYVTNQRSYKYDPRFSTIINLCHSTLPGVAREAEGDDPVNMAEAEFIYGGGFEGLVAGDTQINLGNGRIFNSFAGSCNADILGHTETYIGRNGVDANGRDVAGFPWIRDHVYGGNDLGGHILGSKDFKDRLNANVIELVHGNNGTTADLLNASSYMEYLRGRVNAIFGGCYGDYDYDSSVYRGRINGKYPYLENAFINIRPVKDIARSVFSTVYGAGQGISGFRQGDAMQDRSYVLINIPDGMENFQEAEVFGAGAYDGLGMRYTKAQTLADGFNIDKASAVIDLVSGHIRAAYGASYQEGVTRRTMVNVPKATTNMPLGSTIQVSSIFGGAYGNDNSSICDAYEAHVEYHSQNAIVLERPKSKTIKDENGKDVIVDIPENFVTGAIYGGNNSARRTLYGKINIDVPVYSNVAKNKSATIYGAGFGEKTWSEYTEINLESGASVWEVYGGGMKGRVMNLLSANAYKTEAARVSNENPVNVDLTLDTRQDGYTDLGLEDPLAIAVENQFVPDINGKKYNTNIHIRNGAIVGNYAYGGGLGDETIPTSGDVCGTTYIELLGGQVNKDIYAAGTVGGVLDYYGLGTGDFKASTTAYIGGGTVRNVFGGGWKGDVGRHDISTTDTTNDIDGETHVIIGVRPDQVNKPSDYGYANGVPAIQRNAYSGGEGGAVFGDAHLTINNGYIGYVHLLANQVQNEKGEIVETTTSTTERYEDKVNDETYYEGNEWKGEGTLADCGNVFGGGYDVRSSVDNTYVTMWNGWVRNSLHGGGEIATVGRGATKENTDPNDLAKRTLEGIYKPGSTHIKIYNGHVNRNVFGGGKGYNVQGYGVKGTRYTDGYVFGSTEVYIYGGEVGTPETLAEGYGNVFGGGDIGYVYSRGFFDTASRKTGTGSPNHTYYYHDGVLTEDCKVVVSPYLQLKSGESLTYDGKTYNSYDYVPTDYLNTLKRSKDSEGNWTGGWTKFITKDENDNDRGVLIRNAVFGGGNVASNSSSFANATTVYGNTTATLYDVYNRDFITVGTEHIGGLYGGGNLSVVDGYRELNITNYGTDYYGLNQQISIDEYEKLSNRERAYFKLEYECQVEHTNEGNHKTYKKGDRISEEEYNKLTTQTGTAYWVKYGFCSIYAGRLLNTIQRADLCGVYGSRMVLQGAKDRVIKPDDTDYGKQNVDYTINRVTELSLNKQRSVAGDTGDEAEHGNYFGIYSVVNYMGNLTSDVAFTSPRKKYAKDANNKDIVETTTTSYKDWKSASSTSNRDRNLGTCHNQVALASGVFLELTTEMSNNLNKVYGYITGVVELDLINVKKDIVGGGYVYAKNYHGPCNPKSSFSNIILSDYNKAVSGVHDAATTYRYYDYDVNSANVEAIETSGNFIHRRKHIVDDCYPNNGVYNDKYVKSPAHYWYIKGEVYVYDQTVSAYAGSASAYSKEVKIPLTITAGSNGKLKLLNVKPNLYAYYSNKASNTKIGADGVKVDNETTTFYLNDVITWWDWSLLDDNEKALFVEETYVNVTPCKVNGVEYETGAYVMLPSEYTNFDMTTVKNSQGESFEKKEDVFRSSNNISHDTGYVLTFDMDTPKDWNDWYSPISGASTYTVNSDGTVTTNRKMFDEEHPESAYRVGPTFRLKGGEGSGSGLYGQKQYTVDQIIQKEIVDDYTSTVSQMSPQPTGQASVEPAYVAKNNVTIGSQTILAGNAISKTVYDGNTSIQSNFDQAYVCINTIQFGEDDFLFNGELVGQNDLTTLATKYMKYNNSRENMAEINESQARAYVESCLSSAYICTVAGSYGGQYFKEGENYSALKSWCSLTDDRDKFEFNYDAFDVLADPAYHGEGYTQTYYHSPYSDEKPVEYNAANTTNGPITYRLNGDTSDRQLASGATITREEFENVINEQRYYTRISVPANDHVNVYVALDNFYDHGTPIAKGQVLTEEEYAKLSNTQYMSTMVTLTNETSSPVNKYYCYEAYDNVTVGTVIEHATYNGLPNYQSKFTIQGVEPTETTTLYVSRESVFKDVTKEKVISVVYQYTYYEVDDEGDGVTLTNELHVVNIHLQLESGAPQIGKLSAPPTILPGNTLGMKAPTVNPGLYEVITNGWELFPSEDDYEARRNGVPFINNETQLYWYQNQDYQIAFYSMTYLGKTYSDPVPVSVANYHDLSEVMADKKHHLYIDHKDVDRAPKIYLDHRLHPDENQLDLLKSLHDLSAGKTVGEHARLNTTQVGNCKNLEFILRSNLNHSDPWTPIGDATNCFEGDLHGDGYTISGLDHSLFGHLCGEVYNLGVTGTFTGAGIADNDAAPGGYMENCWVKTSGTVAADTKALFGHPTVKQYPLTNCYYPTENNYVAQTGATAKSLQAFENGEVAYDLNGFYLYKRYCDSKTSLTDNAYKYLVDGETELTVREGHYESKDGPFLVNDKNGNYIGSYVESRLADGDFVYADGTIPTQADPRMRVVTVLDAHNNETSEPRYYPIWPDDYLFFGQSLNYGYVSGVSHQDEPSHINKGEDTRLLTTSEGNRVYRAAGYFQSSTDKRPVHFNPYAVFAKTMSGQPNAKVHEGMTAIDLMTSGTYQYRDGTDANAGTFYPPLLDDDGLTGMLNAGLTQNLLVYTGTGTPAAIKTNTVAGNYLLEPAYAEKDDNYRNVDRVQQADIDEIHGHWIQGGTAVRDHLLVDDNDFNAPIQYSFDDTHRMWYQRMPENYVEIVTSGSDKKTVGWEDVCLPFIADLVTTPDKGEITHFYGDSKTGHEYWLREFTGVDKENPEGELPATFTYPAANSEVATGGGNKTYNNTFLWDYYYNNRDHQDANLDQYQQYYNNTRTFTNYPRACAGVPYLIGFPGAYYYEFDLSGEFVANFTKDYVSNPIPQLPQQAIIFASKPGITVNVSDTELSQGAVVKTKENSNQRFTFRPNYLTTTIGAGNYLLSDRGDKYALTDASSKARPFRPYFEPGGSSGTRGENPVTSIIFNDDDTRLEVGDTDNRMRVGEDFLIDGGRKKITCESQLHYTTDVRIVTPAGITLTTFSIQPSEYVETRVETAGVYIVYADNGKYVKKVIVR